MTDFVFQQSSGNKKPAVKIVMGIDVGSRTTKALIWDGNNVLSRILLPTGWSPAESARNAHNAVLKKVDRQIDRKVITGYGRISLVNFADETVTEITAHARGVGRILPAAKTVIDIGGQDSKAILLENGGLVMDFAMNDRCAAGSGKFLEFLAHSMNLEIEDFAELAFKSQNPIQISSLCTVFAESEVISLLAEGASKEDVAAGVHRSISLRVAAMAKTLNPQPPVAFTGGVARNRCMVRELSRALGMEIITPEFPEFSGALGAAIIALEGF